jgi:toxin ParE1/3/4
MVKISFTSQAKNELKEIKIYISLNSPLQGKRVVQKIFDEIQKLTSHPEIGRPIISTKTNVIRQILVYKYRIFYRVVGESLQVLSIYHGARLLENNPGLQQFFTEE